MVTVAGLFWLATVSTTGDVSPGITPLGTMATTSYLPGSSALGFKVALTIVAGTPPIVTETGLMTLARGLSGGCWPACTLGVVTPSPAAKITIREPEEAGAPV